MESILQIQNLGVSFRRDGKAMPVVDGMSLHVPQGATVALVGESGCGKSVTALSVLRLVPRPPACFESGRVLFHDSPDGGAVDLLTISERDLRRIRGRRIAMIFQEPMTALNPVMTVGQQIVEAVQVHRSIDRRAARDLAVEALRSVRIDDPQQRVDAYPHQLSGGMRQRAMIAMALICEPALLIADEPTTALDPTIQLQLLTLLKEMQRQSGLSILLITHDLGAVREFADYVYVMYAGRIVEQAPVDKLYANPLHPYTQGLLRCTPRLDGPRDRLEVIPGTVPDFSQLPTGCRFHPRCQLTRDRAAETPEEALPIRIDTQGSGRPDRVIDENDAAARVLRRCVEPCVGQPSGAPALQSFGPDHFAACWLVE
ncbi:MAG: ABC transporter ATP-binding protein [Planctomycetes bacterium]|nr:ABC transporter ATP-binding protein [Planctomycetota bacterium]